MSPQDINETLPFAALTIGDAKQLIGTLVADELRKITQHTEPANPQPDTMTTDQALPFLSELGAPTTKKTLYNWIFREVIPFRRIGKRVVFSRTELSAWIESRTTRPDNVRTDAALRIARSANRKSK